MPSKPANFQQLGFVVLLLIQLVTIDCCALDREEPCRIMIHCRMLEDNANAQQVSLGVLGVNLIHSAFIEQDPFKIVNVSVLQLHVSTCWSEGLWY